MKSFEINFYNPVFKTGKFEQYRFYNPEFKLGEKRYFVDFSFVASRAGYDSFTDFSDYINKIYIGYAINRKTKELDKLHIWIKDLETNKRALPEVYELLRKKIEDEPPYIFVSQKNDSGEYEEVHSYASKNIFEWSELK